MKPTDVCTCIAVTTYVPEDAPLEARIPSTKIVHCSAHTQVAGERERLLEALRACAEKFREYERLHRAKVDALPNHGLVSWGNSYTKEAGVCIDKAEANARMAELCERAIAGSAEPAHCTDPDCPGTSACGKEPK